MNNYNNNLFLFCIFFVTFSCYYFFSEVSSAEYENECLKRNFDTYCTMNIALQNSLDYSTKKNKELRKNAEISKKCTNLMEFCTGIVKKDYISFKAPINMILRNNPSGNKSVPAFMWSLTTASHENIMDMFLMEYLSVYAYSVIKNTEPVFDLGSDVLFYFVRNTRLGSGYEILPYGKSDLMQADIANLNKKYAVNFGDENNIRILLSYIIENALRVTINNDSFLNKIIERSFKIGYLSKFCQEEKYDAKGIEDFKKFISENFVPSFKKGIKNRGYFVYNGEHFNKIKLPNSYELDNIMRYFSCIDVSYADYQNTLNDFLKKLLYLCVRPEIIGDVIENLDENMNHNLYFRDKYDKLLDTYYAEMYGMSYLYKQGNNADAWIIPVTK